jgi:hypothetical protein
MYTNVVPRPGLPPVSLRQRGAADAGAGVVADHRGWSQPGPDDLMLRTTVRRPSEDAPTAAESPAGADHRHIEDLPGPDRCHHAEGVSDLGVGRVD